MLTKEYINNMTQEDLAGIATGIADYITIRDYDDYGSIDTRRLTTPEEHTVIFNIVYTCLLAYGRRESSDLDSLLDMAEFLGHRFIDNMNTYDTIYLPIKRFLQIL